MNHMQLFPTLLMLTAITAWSPQDAAAPAKPANTAVVPAERMSEAWWAERFAKSKQSAERGDTSLLFIGDSITQGWEEEGAEVWAKSYAPREALNLGFSGDRTQHVLWRLDHMDFGALAKPAAGQAAPKLAVVMIGTNNSNGDDNTAREIADGITAVVKSLRAKLPRTKVLLLAIFPRGEKPDAQRAKNAEASRLASSIADGVDVVYLDIGAKLLEPDGTLSKEVMPDLLHLSPKGYAIWAEAIEPKVRELSGEKP